MSSIQFFRGLLTAAGMCAAGLASPVQAASLVQVQTFSFHTDAATSGRFVRDESNPYYAYYSTTATDSVTLNFNGFDPALGTLTGFRLSLDGEQRLTGALNAPARFGVPSVGAREVASQSTSLVVGGFALTTAAIAAEPIDCEAMADGCFSLSPANGVLAFDQSTAYSGAFGASVFQIVNRATTSGYLFGFGVFDEGAISSVATARVEGALSLTYFYDPASAPPAIPEPDTWAMLILGLGAAGGTMRKRTLERQPASG